MIRVLSLNLQHGLPGAGAWAPGESGGRGALRCRHLSGLVRFRCVNAVRPAPSCG